MEKIALITGASKGIGKALAFEFAKNGYSLILIARTLSELEILQKDLHTQYQTESKIFTIDLQQPDCIDKIMTNIQPYLENLEVLVNNAGYGISKKFSETPEVDINGMLDVNIMVLTKLTYRILPFMQKKQKGKILNVASTAAYTPGPYMAIYYASKAFVLSFSEALHEECKKDHITVSALCPGMTTSAFHQRAGNPRLSGGWVPTMTSEAVAKIGYNGLMRNQRVVIAGFANKLSRILMHCLPNILLMKVIAFLDTK